MQDIRFAMRTFWKSPAFTAIAVLALALGIGANSAIFSVVNSVLLRPLPFQEPERLCSISTIIPGAPFFKDIMMDPDREALDKSNSSFEEIGVWSRGRTSLTGFGEPIRVDGREVSPGFWRALRVGALMGRTFLPAEDDGEQSRVVVLSNKLWRTHFRGDRSIVGKAVRLDGNTHTIIGVMPPEFNFPAGAELWTPPVKPGGHNMMARWVIGRLKPGVTIERAQSEAQAIVANSQAATPNPAKGLRVVTVSLQEFLVGKVRPSLMILLGAVGFILLIACANVANLLLARGAGRRQEVAVRASLGATRWRLMRQLLTESSLLALLGGGFGLLIALWAVPLLLKLTPPGIVPRLGEVSIDGQVLSFTLFLSLVTSLFFGAVPAVQLSKAGLAEFLKQDDRRLTGGQRLRSVLVAGEIALSLMLLIGAGLMIKSFVLLRSVNPGFQPEHVQVMTVDLPPNELRTTGQLVAYHQRVLDKLAALPGVIAAGSVNWLPMDHSFTAGSFQVEGQPKKATQFGVMKPGVSPDYLRALGIHLLRGRSFDQRDTENSESVAVISQMVAKRVWGDEDPLGKRVTLEDDPKPKDWLTVVGVVDDVKQMSLAEKKPMPAIYQPLTQVTRPFFLSHMAYVVRSTGNPSATIGLMRSGFRALDSNQPIQRIGAMDDLLDATTVEPQFYSRMLGSFSAIALLLASIGIYGVMAYSVAQRTREIGIRVALGAQRGNIFRSVIGRSAVVIASGVAIGLAGAFAVTRVLEKLLYEIKPTDAATYVVVPAILIAVALLASYLPAKRATTVDPMVALRYE
ncbi:MAG TPA: ABC transporter permease [Bryobacteraceae bacterium]|nr:ABC transporter permease [Bryobacteraceae bacterium]